MKVSYEPILTRIKTAREYAYRLTSLGAEYYLYFKNGYYHIKVGDQKVPVYFNPDLFTQFEEIPMVCSMDDAGTYCWDMLLELNIYQDGETIWK
jgi:hypothetical protein